MPLLRKGVLIPVEGVNFATPATFISDRSGFPKNVRYYKDELRKRPGKSVMGSQISDEFQIMGLGRLEIASSKYLVRASKTALEKLNTSTDEFEDIANQAFTGGDEDFFSFATVTEDELLIITNGVDPIKKWTGSGSVANLGGSPPTSAKYCTYLSPYLLVAHMIESGDINPWKVRWPDTNNPENWTTGNSGEALLSDDPSPIQNIMKLNEFAAVYKQESLYLGRKVDTSDVFLFDPAWTGIGLVAPRAVGEAEGYHYFMGANDFYRWNGLRPESIGAPLRDEVFSRINREKIKRCFSLHIQELNEIWFFVIIAGYNWPTEIWKYNYRTGYWYEDTCSELTAAVKWERVNTRSWDNFVGSWDSAQTLWDAGATVAKWEEIVFGDRFGYCHRLNYETTNDSGEAVDARFDSKDFTGDILEFNKRWLQLDLWARGPGKLYVDYSTDEGSTWTNIPYTPSQAYIDLDGQMRKWEMFFDIIADKIRFRFRNSESGETFILRNFYPYYLAREQIRTRRT